MELKYVCNCLMFVAIGGRLFMREKINWLAFLIFVIMIVIYLPFKLSQKNLNPHTRVLE
jgi:hypothetical protein